MVQPKQERVVQSKQENILDSTQKQINIPTNAQKRINTTEITPKKLNISKYSKLHSKVHEIVDRTKKNECLKYSPQLKTISRKMDQTENCDEEGNFVCHHCHRKLCESHSYWIPDEEFPFVVKRTKKDEIRINIAEIIKGKKRVKIGIVFLLFFIFIIPVFIGIYLIYEGMKQIKFGKAHPIIIGEFYPRYYSRHQTKWGKHIFTEYEHRGFYTAVHCWECLNQYHVPYMQLTNAAMEHFEKITLREVKSLGELNRPFNRNEKNAMKNMVGNLFMDSYKRNLAVGMPLFGTTRLVHRPQEFSNPTRPSPVWLFYSRATKNAPVKNFNLQPWVNGNKNQILNYGNRL